MTTEARARELLAEAPCDGWPWARSRAWPSNRYQFAADRKEPLSIEGLDPREATPALGLFLPYVRTDYDHWSNSLDWTLESGPDGVPASVEIVVPYSYSPGCGDYFAGGCWNPGDPPEVETGQPWFVNEAGERCEVSLLEAEQEPVGTYIYENPPEPDYGDDY